MKKQFYIRRFRRFSQIDLACNSSAIIGEICGLIASSPAPKAQPDSSQTRSVWNVSDKRFRPEGTEGVARFPLSLQDKYPGPVNPDAPCLATAHRRPTTTLQRSRSQIKNQKSKIGFTLVELLVVIAIIAILAAILLPVLSQAQLRAKRIQCLNNVGQMAMAAQIYSADNSAYYPIAYYFDSAKNISYCWDFTTYESSSRVVPGVLWQGQTNPQIQQCPTYNGNANWYGDPYTGYNYNTSYIGHGQGEAVKQPAKDSAVRHPAKTVIFGDGQWSEGADKFMRAPWPDTSNAGDSSDADDLRASGTQGFRHNGLSNATFCDGHAESLSACYTNYAVDPYNPAAVAKGTGFLSVSNSIYDLE